MVCVMQLLFLLLRPDSETKDMFKFDASNCFLPDDLLDELSLLPNLLGLSVVPSVLLE